MILEVYAKSEVLGTGPMACKIDRVDNLMAYTPGLDVCFGAMSTALYLTLKYKIVLSIGVCLDIDGFYATNDCFKNIFISENICIRKIFFIEKSSGGYYWCLGPYGFR